MHGSEREGEKCLMVGGQGPGRSHWAGAERWHHPPAGAFLPLAAGGESSPETGLREGRHCQEDLCGHQKPVRKPLLQWSRWQHAPWALMGSCKDKASLPGSQHLALGSQVPPCQLAGSSEKWPEQVRALIQQRRSRPQQHS